MTALPDGWLVYRLKRPLANGRTALVMQPTELLRRLATLVPPPRHNLVRYHGVFAPNAAWRAAIVPPPPEEPEPATAEPVPMAATVPRKAKARLPWAELLLRVFREDVLQCDRCGGRRAVIAFITQPQVIKAILQHLGLPTTGPPVSAARSTLQPDLFCQDEQAPDDRDVS